MSSDAHPAAATLDGKVLLVIGGTTGLGFAALQAFIQNRAKVVAVGRDLHSLETAQQQFGKKALTLLGDASVSNTAAAVAGSRRRRGVRK